MGQDAAATTETHSVDPQRWARHIRRWTLVFAGIMFVVAFAVFGTRWVPAGMHTVPEAPPGAYCILDKRKSAAQVGRTVFLEAPNGQVVLSRVSARDSDTVTVMHPNADAGVPDSRTFGALPISALRGTVICVFPPDTTPEMPRGK